MAYMSLKRLQGRQWLTAIGGSTIIGLKFIFLYLAAFWDFVKELYLNEFFLIFLSDYFIKILPFSAKQAVVRILYEEFAA